MTDTLGKIVSLNTANNLLAGEKERFREQASWLNQVAGYHHDYACTMREVEMMAAEEDEAQAPKTNRVDAAPGHRWGAMMTFSRHDDACEAITLGRCGFFPCDGAHDN